MINFRLRITYPNGDIFEGIYNENKKREGPGVYKFAKIKKEGGILSIFNWLDEDEEQPEDEEEEEGEGKPKKQVPRFEGMYIDGKKCGKGVLYTRNGEMYYGEWDDDLPNGRGAYKYENGDIYDGEWEKGQKQGEGTYLFTATGTRLKGVWDQNSIQSGQWVFKDGTTVESQFKNNKPFDDAVIKFYHGAIRHGEFFIKALDEDELMTQLVWKTTSN